MKRQPPFYGNPDGVHCLQCCLQMALGHFKPQEATTLAQIDRLTGRRSGEGSWSMSAYLFLPEMGFAVRVIEPMDFEQFAESPTEYMAAHYPAEVAEQIALEYDLEAARDVAKSIGSRPHIDIEQRPAEFEDLVSLLEQGYLVICNVSFQRIRGQEGLEGHSVLVYDVTATDVVFHDPGSIVDWRLGSQVSRQDFMHAWSYLGAGNRELFALRLLEESDKRVT